MVDWCWIVGAVFGATWVIDRWLCDWAYGSRHGKEKREKKEEGRDEMLLVCFFLFLFGATVAAAVRVAGETTA